MSCFQVIELRQKEVPYLLPEDVFIDTPRCVLVCTMCVLCVCVYVVLYSTVLVCSVPGYQRVWRKPRGRCCSCSPRSLR